MYVPKDANLRELVVAERAVATKCRENEFKCATIKLLFKVQLHMLLTEIIVIMRNPLYCFKNLNFLVWH